MPKAPNYWHVQRCSENGEWQIISQPCRTELEAQSLADQALCPQDETVNPPTAVWIVSPAGEFYRWTSNGPELVEFTFVGYAIHWHRKPGRLDK